jgi:hypothetical protein
MLTFIDSNKIRQLWIIFQRDAPTLTSFQTWACSGARCSTKFIVKTAQVSNCWMYYAHSCDLPWSTASGSCVNTTWVLIVKRFCEPYAGFHTAGTAERWAGQLPSLLCFAMNFSRRCSSRLMRTSFSKLTVKPFKCCVIWAFAWHGLMWYEDDCEHDSARLGELYTEIQP